MERHGKGEVEPSGVEVELEVEFEGMSSVYQMGSEFTEVGWRLLESW